MWRGDSSEKTLMLGLGAGGEGDDRGWDGWMASPTWWMWVWVNSGSWWLTGRHGVLRFMGSQRVGHDWATELGWTELNGHQPPSLSVNCLLHPSGVMIWRAQAIYIVSFPAAFAVHRYDAAIEGGKALRKPVNIYFFKKQNTPDFYKINLDKLRDIN